ncbi:MAG: SDR family oxidoreductase [Bacteroidetes bacterium]|nr:SDR family oxidoreductase [Bacteroidota bacterium]
MKNKKVCIVTGALGGLGRIVIEHLTEDELTVIGIDHGSPGNTPVDRSWTYIQTDVLSEDSVHRTYEKVISEFARIDVLVNLVGGIYPWSNIEDVSLENWEKTIALNLRSVFLMCRGAIRQMKKQNGGKIINVGAQAGVRGASQAGPYGSAKSAVINLSETIAAEGKSCNIQCNVIIPSIIDTAANRKSMPDATFSDWVQPAEIANLIGFLASDKSSGVTGSVIQAPGRV